MPNILKPFLDNLTKGTLNPKGNFADFQHGARLFVDDSFRLAPKQKFLYHVSFNINSKAAAIIPNFNSTVAEELNMLVKSVDLPKYTIQTNTVHQYNKKRKLQTRLDYDPINIVFHDDNYGITTAMWQMYYQYYFRDGNYGNKDGTNTISSTTPIQYNRGNTLVGEVANKFKYGMDSDAFIPFFESIQIYQMARKRYTCYTLINPIITSWQGDNLAYGNNDPAANSMTIEYETVFMSRGPVTAGTAPKGFATRHYDKTPSPLSLAGGGTTSVFGVGGVLGGLFGLSGDKSAFSDIEGGGVSGPGSLLRTAIQTANRLKNLKRLSKEGLREEGYNIIKEGIGRVGGTSVSGVANTLFPKNTPNANNVTQAILKRR
jgi:hypothetical protein